MTGRRRRERNRWVRYAVLGLRTLIPRRGRRWRLVRRTGYVLGGLVLLLGVGVGVLYSQVKVPPVSAAARAEASILSYRDGTPLAQVGRLNRVAVPLRAVPAHLRGAVLAAEDRGFYHEPVVSPVGLTRAVWSAVSGGPRQGGSGIAQQYVKVAYLSPRQTLSRKVRELFIAVKLNRARSKDWILEQYLNTVYFGRGAYGVQAAAQAYFRKDVGTLTPAESALLAGMIQAPSYLDPALGHTAQTQARWRYVIDGMMSTGVLPKGPRPAFPNVAPAHTDPLYGGQRGYLIERITSELHARGFSDDAIYRRGLRVTTTLDPAMQAEAPRAVAKAVGRDKDLEAGLVSVRPGTGEILAAYGGRDYLKHQYDNAFLAELPSGSSFAPFVLATALDKGIGLRSMIDASPMKDVLNDDDENAGVTSLLGATARSYNTAFARLAAKTGASEAGRAGLPTTAPSPRIQDPGSPATPPSPRVHAVDEAAAYAALVDGRYAAPHIVAQVKDSSGKTLLTVRPSVRRAFSSGAAADVTFALGMGAMADAKAEALAGGKSGGPRRAPLLDRPMAGQRGTTDHNAAAWYCGYTPSVATAVVTYRASNKPLINRGDAPLRETTDKPAAIWSKLMMTAVAGLALQDFSPPAWVGTARQFATPTPAPAPAGPSPRMSAPVPAPRATRSKVVKPPVDPSELRKHQKAGQKSTSPMTGKGAGASP
ncbi:penicillin-binding protein [Actinoallomurus purpureus]|uniref:transglycosylase domain-containing protein n=1 Tax=Actinoallomurus purpureus TaxID=478114 RepID=UPI002092C37C|nr:transglycosylase domain-containing protein [Actinoallomurus purpureus]MCO6007700.1 penicillin-binding protein [Actinoallomurus purpureus]